MIHPSSHWLKNAAATNEHVATYTRLYLHLKAQRSVLESIQSQIYINLEKVIQRREGLPSTKNNNNINKQNENLNSNEDINIISADETTLSNCFSSIDMILKSDIKTAIFEASNFIMKTKDFPLSQCSPETVKLVNIFTTSCVALIKFPVTLLAFFCEINKKNNFSNQNSNKNNNSKAKKETTILDSPIKAYIENDSYSDEYDYSFEESDEISYSTYSIDSTTTSSIESYTKVDNDTNNNNNNNEGVGSDININSNNNNNNDNSNNDNVNINDNGNTNLKKKGQKSRNRRKRNAKKAPTTVICRLCNEPIPINLFAEHIKSCAIAFKSELKVQDVNQMLLQQYDAIGARFISAPWPGERQKAVDVTLPMLHLSILLMRAHDIEENTNDSLEELENIERSILHIPIAQVSNDQNNDKNNGKGNKLYRNVSNYNNTKMKPTKNKYKHVSLKPLGSGLLNQISKCKARNIPIKKSKDLKITSNESNADSTISDTESINANVSNDNTSNSTNSIINSSNNNSDSFSDYSNSSKRNSIDISNNSPIFPYINDSLKLLREKINLTVVLCAASDILRSTRVSGSDKIITASYIQITNFEFIKLISAGAYARVFLAKMKTTGDVCAVKVTPKSSCTHKNEVLQLLTEKNIMLKFNNPYIVTFYCSFIGLNNLYLVMEYLPGGDLYSLLQNIGSFDEDTAKLYTYEIVLALKYLHTNGIIHRDLKPDNILISKEGKIKLTDFGLSHLGLIDRRNNEEPVEDEETKIIGTPDYIAPEILLEKKHTYTCDYWSLGCMVYEFLIGIPPFHADTEEETFKNILRGQYDLSSDVGIEDFSDEAIEFIKALLVTDPTKRLGANGIDEILNHTWFKGVDPDKDEPPFIPELNSVYDTEYFKQRYQFKDDDSDIIEDINYETERNKEREKEKEDKLSQSSVSSQNLLPIGSSSSEISSTQIKDKSSSEILSENSTSSISKNISTSSVSDSTGNTGVITESDKFDYLTNEAHSHSGVINAENTATTQATDSPLVPLPTSFSSNVLKNYASVGVEQIIRRNEEILSYAQKQQEQERQNQQENEKENDPPILERRSNRQRARYLSKKKPASFDLAIDGNDGSILSEYYNIINKKEQENTKNEETNNPEENEKEDSKPLKKIIRASSSETKLLSLTDVPQCETEPNFPIITIDNLSFGQPVHNSSVNSPLPSPSTSPGNSTPEANNPTLPSNPASLKNSASKASISNSASATPISNSPSVASVASTASTASISNSASATPVININLDDLDEGNLQQHSTKKLIETVKNEIRKVSCSSSHPSISDGSQLFHSISCSGSDPFEASELVKTMILSQFSSSPVSTFLGINEMPQVNMTKISKSTKNFIQLSNSTPDTPYDNNRSSSDTHVNSSGSNNSNSSASGNSLDPLTAFSDALQKSRKPMIILDSPYTMKRMKNWKEDPRAVLRRIRAKHRKNVKKLSTLFYHRHNSNNNV